MDKCILNGIVNLLRQQSIKKRLLYSFIIICVMPCMIVGIFSVERSIYDMNNKISYYTEQSTRQASVNIDTIISYVEKFSDRISKDHAVQNEFIDGYDKGVIGKLRTDSMITSLLDDNMYSFLEIDGITIANVKGDYSVYRGNKLISLNYTNSPLFIDTISDGKISFWRAPFSREIGFVSNKVDQHVAVYTKKIREMWSGEIVGVLFISLKLSAFEAAFSRMELWDNGYVGIINSDGFFVYNSNKSLIGTKIGNDEFLKHIQENSKSNSSFVEKVDGKRLLISSSELRHNGWNAVSIIPYSSLMSQVSQTSIIIVMITLLSILLSVIMAYVLSNSLIDPINKLVSEIQEVESGNMENDEIDISGNDEITFLNKVYRQTVNENSRLMSELYKAQIAQKESQIQALKAQINPHFLYNTLDTINSLAKIHHEKDISEMTTQLSSLFRYSIKSNEKYVTVDDEITNVTNYLKIMKIRHEEKLDFQIEVEESIRWTVFLPKLIIQPLIENAVCHGIEMKKGKGKVKIEVYTEEKSLFIHVLDDGIGMDNLTLNKIKEKINSRNLITNGNVERGIGLINVCERLRIYYKEDYRFDIKSSPGEGTEISIELPLIERKDERGNV